MKRARFAICRYRRGTLMERFRPSLARKDREIERMWVDRMKEDAKRWGDTLKIERIREAATA